MVCGTKYLIPQLLNLPEQETNAFPINHILCPTRFSIMLAMGSNQSFHITQ